LALAFEQHETRPVGGDIHGPETVHHLGQITAAEWSAHHAALVALAIRDLARCAFGGDAADAIVHRTVAAGDGPAQVIDAIVPVGRGLHRLHLPLEMFAQTRHVHPEIRQPGAQHFSDRRPDELAGWTD